MSLLTSLISAFWNRVGKKDAKRLALQSPPQDVAEITDIDYAGAGDKMRFADVYFDKSAADSVLPVIFDIHGGGWYYGDKELNKIYAMHLTGGGKFKVVNISYRLCPSATLAEQLCDVTTAISYFAARADEYGFDKNNLFITGDSAGGNLAAMTVKASVNKAMAEYYGLGELPRFNAVGFTSAAFRLSQYEKPLVSGYFRPLFKDLPPVREYVDYDADISSDYPPSYIITGNGDFLRRENLSVAEKLIAAHIPCAVYDYDGNEKFIHVHNVCYPDSDIGKAANDGMLNFFGSYIKNL